jgi:hypothetical protein
MNMFFERLSDDVTGMSGELDSVAKYTRNSIFVLILIDNFRFHSQSGSGVTAAQTARD